MCREKTTKHEQDYVKIKAQTSLLDTYWHLFLKHFCMWNKMKRTECQSLRSSSKFGLWKGHKLLSSCQPKQLYVSQRLRRLSQLWTTQAYRQMCLPQPSLLWWLWFDFPVGLLFSFLWLCLVYLHRLVSEGVCGRLCSFFVSKPQSPRPRSHKPGLCPLHPPLHPADTRAFTHANTHSQTRIGPRGQVQASIYAHPKHAHLFLMLVSLHILAGCAHLFKQLPLSSVAGCRQKHKKSTWRVAMQYKSLIWIVLTE